MTLLVVCFVLVLGIVFASQTFAAYAAGEDGTAPTIIRTGGIDVDRKNHMGNLPAAIKGKPYKAADGSNYKIEATGTEPFTFHAYKSGEGRAPLPEGLSLNPTTGEIEGTPTGETGSYNISVTVTNKYGSDNIFVGMYVYDETSKPQITTPAGALPDGYLNSSYNQKINFTHNMSNFPKVSIASGALPDGLRIIRQGITATIYGTPTKARTFTFTVRVENGAGFDEKQYTITIKNEIVRPKIQMDMTVIKDGYSKVNDSGHLEIIKGKPVDVQFYATGTNTSDNPIKWSCDTSVLPAGLTLSGSGHLTGTVPESVDLGLGTKHYSVQLKAKNYNNEVEQTSSWSPQFVVCENGKIAGITTISPENTSVPKGGQRQFTATVIGYGDFDKSVTWNVYYNSSDNTKISQDGVLTVGIDETATKIGVEAKSKDGSLREIPVTIIDHMHSTTLVPEKPKTCTTDGNIAHYKCNVCGDLFADAGGVHSRTEEQVKIPAGHEYGDLVPKQEPTCTKTGMQAHYKCSVCNKYFDESKNEKTVEELTISINPNAHDFGAWIEEVPATCVGTGTKGHKDCNRCNKHYDESGNEITDLTISINPNAHDFGAWTDEVPATCVATGTKGHKDCNRCNKHYDKSGNEIIDLTIPIDPSAHELGDLVAEVPATCKDTGVKAHKDCSRCNKHYDESGNEITDLTIPTNDNHDWNAWVSNLDGTHTRTCKRDSSHKENGTCSGGTATCTTKAVCDFCRRTYGDTAPHNTTKYNGKDSSGHWDTCSTCDNKFNFEAHTPDREKADETNPVKCTKCGFVITPAGHYEHMADSEWHNSADGTYHYHECTHSGCSVILDKANHSGGTATCENKAVCSVCGLEYGDKLGHDYGEVKYTWTSDNTCKAERVCKHDSTHIESETVTATGTTITAATCKEKGKMKYTATFANTAFTVQEKEVDIDFAPHTFGEWQDEIPATTEDFGTKGHKDCTACGKHFDKDGNEITELRIAKIGTHNVIVNGESKFYKEGESVTVTAQDKEGKVFTGWQDASGNIVSTEKEYTFKVEGEKTLTAVYKDKPSDDGEITPPAKKDGLSGGQIAGIVIGSVLFAGIGGFAIFWFAVKKKTFADLIAAIKALFTKKK